MSLRTEILELLPENVYSVNVGRSKVRGEDCVNVVVKYRDPAMKAWYLDINFTEKNKMTAEHMAAVINSHIKFD